MFPWRAFIYCLFSSLVFWRFLGQNFCTELIPRAFEYRLLSNANIWWCFGQIFVQKAHDEHFNTVFSRERAFAGVLDGTITKYFLTKNSIWYFFDRDVLVVSWAVLLNGKNLKSFPTITFLWSEFQTVIRTNFSRYYSDENFDAVNFPFSIVTF